MFFVIIGTNIMNMCRTKTSKEETKPLLNNYNIKNNYKTTPLIDEQEFKAKKYIYCGLSKENVSFVIFIFLFVIYLLVGAVIFSKLESSLEETAIGKLRNARTAFLTKYQNVNVSDLDKLVAVIVAAANRGIEAHEKEEPTWSFTQSIFFSTTVLTTIGYGHITPMSSEGKIFCIIYALIGIPLTLVLLTACVKRLQIPSTILLNQLDVKFGHIYNNFYIRLIHLIIIGMTIICFCMILPAYIFARIEPEWAFTDAFYYCFISLTTIGLGDYIPGDAPDQSYRPLYKIITTVYLFLGLICMMLFLSTFYEIPQLNLGRLFMPQVDFDPEAGFPNYSTKSIDEQNKIKYNSETQTTPKFPIKTDDKSVIYSHYKNGENDYFV